MGNFWSLSLAEACWSPYFLPIPPPFSNFVEPPSLTFLSPPTPNPRCSFCCPVSLAEWVIMLHLMCNFNGSMDLHMSSLGILVPEGPWYVFFATRCQGYWSLTHNVDFYWYSDLIWHTHTNTQAHTPDSGSSRLTHPYKYIFTPPVMCSQ